MIVLFDHGTPLPLRTFLKAHTVLDAKSQGWDTLGNGELLDAAEAAGIEVLLTTDKNIRYQQNLAGRKIAVVVLGNAQWPVLQVHASLAVAAINDAKPGTYTEVEIPESETE
jgi:hypothetical protein